MIVTFGVLEEIIASSKNKFRIKMLCVTASLICFAFTCVTCREYNVTSESLESANVNEFNLLNIKLSSKIEDIARLYRLESGNYSVGIHKPTPRSNSTNVARKR